MDNSSRPDNLDHSDPPETSGLAIMAAVCSFGSIGMVLIAILSIFGSGSDTVGPGFLAFCGLSVLANIIGLILGISALFQIEKGPSLKGKGLAVAAILIGLLSMFFYYFAATLWM